MIIFAVEKEKYGSLTKDSLFSLSVDGLAEKRQKSCGNTTMVL